MFGPLTSPDLMQMQSLLASVDHTRRDASPKRSGGTRRGGKAIATVRLPSGEQGDMTIDRSRSTEQGWIRTQLQQMASLKPGPRAKTDAELDPSFRRLMQPQSIPSPESIPMLDYFFQRGMGVPNPPAPPLPPPLPPLEHRPSRPTPHQQWEQQERLRREQRQQYMPGERLRLMRT